MANHFIIMKKWEDKVAAIELMNVAKHFDAFKVIDDLSLSINRGEFIVLVGPSGCGKSTLLRMIAGLETISAGNFMIDGQRANDIPPQKRNIAMVFQSYALFPHMSVYDNIAFGPRIRREDKNKMAGKIKNAADILNLKAYLARKPGELSGGQRQRVAMGRAIVRDPKLFLFDEPLSNLDAQLRVQMRTEIKALHQKLQTTIIYVTHDQIEAMTMADRIVVMNKGAIEQVGSPLELYDRPANRFVASFIGSPAMGLMDGLCKRATDNTTHIILDGGSQLSMQALDIADGAAVSIGIRPECFRISPSGEFPFDVEVVEPTGPEVHLFGRIADIYIRVVLRDRILPKVGERVHLTANCHDIHLFDQTTGARFVM